LISKGFEFSLDNIVGAFSRGVIHKVGMQQRHRLVLFGYGATEMVSPSPMILFGVSPPATSHPQSYPRQWRI